MKVFPLQSYTVFQFDILQRPREVPYKYMCWKKKNYICIYSVLFFSFWYNMKYIIVWSKTRSYFAYINLTLAQDKTVAQESA